MMSTKIFLYHQRHRVILLDSDDTNIFSRRYNQVYTKNLTAHKGTDNQILIEFVNQDQKRVDVTGMEFTCRLISHNGEELLLEKPLVEVNTLRGQTKLVLTERELDAISQQTVGFSIEQVANGLYEPVFVDDNAGARGNLDIVDSILPAFTASKILTIPDHGLNTTYVTSILETEAVDLHTFQFDLDQFTGSIEVKGATDVSGPWYNIDTATLTLSDSHVQNVEGFHPYIQFTITETAGEVTQIQYR